MLISSPFLNRPSHRNRVPTCEVVEHTFGIASTSERRHVLGGAEPPWDPWDFMVVFRDFVGFHGDFHEEIGDYYWISTDSYGD